MEDSDAWKTTARTKTPVRDMLKGASGRAFIQVYITMTGVFFAVNMLGSLMPQLLLANKGYEASDLAHSQLVNAWPGIAGYLFYGWLSDRIGRKRAFYIAGTVLILLAPVTLTLIGSGHVHGWGSLTLLGGRVAGRAGRGADGVRHVGRPGDRGVDLETVGVPADTPLDLAR